MFGNDRDALICQVIDVARDVIDYVVLPVMAILICIFYDKLKKKTADEEKN